MEGCLEEVAAGGMGLEESAASSPDQIEEYLARTGFELVVPNIGTESVTARQVGGAVAGAGRDGGTRHRPPAGGCTASARCAGWR